MAKNILVCPGVMEENARNIREYANLHRELIGKMTNLVLTINEVWTGAAQEAFVANYQGMSSSLNEFDDALESFADLMIDINKKFKETDNHLKGIINSIQ